MSLDRNLFTKAKEVKNIEELIALAKENGVELTEEKAKDYFAKFQLKNGELADDELDNVAGGNCNPYGDACPKCGCSKVDKKLIPDKGYAWCCAECGEFIDWDF